ncbi:hypothetical protein EAH72_33730 [Pseudomonas caspiana]|nr:hypothetical protein [Pseudomonas caspiana]TPG88088.1 hypothetical protein EAH72_33730 [Pseudomonas caspiana]
MTENTRDDADAAFETVGQLQELLAGVPSSALFTIDAFQDDMVPATLVLLTALDEGELRPERVLSSAVHRITHVCICEASGVLGEEQPTPEPMPFKTSSGADLFITPGEVGHALILGGDAELSRFNPLEAARTAPEFMVQLLEQASGITLGGDEKKAVLSVLADLPEGATMRDLLDAIKAKEAASLGITAEQYEALSPLFQALQRILAEGVHTGLFTQHPDK